MTQNKRRPFRLVSARSSDVIVTRDGREVLKWEVVENPEDVLWATKVTAKAREDKRKRVTYFVNHNGRRFANVQSEDDLFIVIPRSREDVTDAPRDCMPDTLRGVEAIRNGDWSAVRSSNKNAYNYRVREGLEPVSVAINKV